MPGVGGVAERHQRHLLGRVAAAGQQRPGHRAVPEQGLHPERGARHPVVDHGVAPQAELPAGGRHQLIGNQPQCGDPASSRNAPSAALLGRPPAA
jgi:hypothetical protein